MKNIIIIVALAAFAFLSAAQAGEPASAKACCSEQTKATCSESSKSVSSTAKSACCDTQKTAAKSCTANGKVAKRTEIVKGAVLLAGR